MKKKLIAFLTALLLFSLSAVPAPASSIGGGQNVESQTEELYNTTLYRLNDFTGTLTQQEIDELDDPIYNAVPRMEFDFPIFLTDDSYREQTDLAGYADYLYENNSYGYGNTRDGIFLVADLTNEEFILRLYGRAFEIFDTEDLDAASEDFRRYAAEGDYYEAVDTYYDYVSTKLIHATTSEGKVYDPSVTAYPETIITDVIPIDGEYESPYREVSASPGTTPSGNEPSGSNIGGGESSGSAIGGGESSGSAIGGGESSGSAIGGGESSRPTGDNGQVLPDWFPENPAEFEFFHDENAPRVVDNADIFTDAEEAMLLSRIQESVSQTQSDIVIYTDNTSYGYSHAVWAADFYDFNGYGYGPERDGACIFICMEPGNRGWWTCCTGSNLRNLYTESMADKIDDRLEPYMVDGDYAEGIADWIGNMNDLVTKGRLSKTKSQMVFYAVLSAIGGLIIGAIATAIRGASMRTVSKAYEAGQYIERNSFRVLNSRDVYTHTTRTRVYDPPSSSSGGSSGGSGRSSYSGSYSGHSGSSHSGSGRSF